MSFVEIGCSKIGEFDKVECDRSKSDSLTNNKINSIVLWSSDSQNECYNNSNAIVYRRGCERERGEL